MNRDEYAAEAKKGASAIWTWGHAHTYLSGIATGVIGVLLLLWLK